VAAKEEEDQPSRPRNKGNHEKAALVLSIECVLSFFFDDIQIMRSLLHYFMYI
jgi:hypothetical protein